MSTLAPVPCLGCLACFVASRYGFWWVAVAFFASRDMKVQVQLATGSPVVRGRGMERKYKYAKYIQICQICHIYCLYCIYCILCNLCIGFSRSLACDRTKHTVKISWVFCDMSLHEQQPRCRWALCPMWGGAFLSFYWLLNGKSDRWCLWSTLNMLWYA